MVNFKNTNKWAKAFYIAAIVAAVVFVYMLFASFSYMAQNAVQYGVGIGTLYGFKGILQTLVGSTFEFVVYAFLLWGMGLLLNKALGDKAEKKEEEPAEIEEFKVNEVPAIPEDVTPELSTQWKRQFNQW